MKILLAGDTHGNISQAKILCQVAEDQGCQVIFQLGDWGYTWPGYREPMKMYGDRGRLALLQNELVRVDIPMLWIDGNHENFPDLQERGFWRADKMCPFEDANMIQYVPRGCVWEWDGVRFMAMGGAWSIDQDDRTPGRSWWPEETISVQDQVRGILIMERELLGGGQIDVFLSHDAPFGVPKLERQLSELDFKWRLADKHIRGSRGNRQALLEVVRVAKPKRLYHGHFHWRYDDWLNINEHMVQVTGLAQDGTDEKSWTVLDTEEVKGGA